MAEPFKMKIGETARALRVALQPASRVLTGATVVFRMKRKGGANVIANGAATIVIATGTPTVEYTWQAGDVAQRGDFEAEFVVTYPGGRIEKFPCVGFIPVLIEADAA